MTVPPAAGDTPGDGTEQDRPANGNNRWLAQARRIREAAVQEHLRHGADAVRRAADALRLASQHYEAAARLIDEDDEADATERGEC